MEKRQADSSVQGAPCYGVACEDPPSGATAERSPFGDDVEGSSR